jgi:Protein of unknown function (DUF3866)
VTAVRRAWAGAVELVVAVDGEGAVPALAYPALVGQPELGDAVLLNTTAFALELGTGGHALVVALPERLPPDPTGPGHLVKARYTPVQATVLGVDEEDSPHAAMLAASTSIDGMPVVVADLHSALAPVVAGVRAALGTARIGYILTDGGALPAWYSRTVAGLRSAGLLAGTVSVGQAFGGDLEAVTVHTGLLAVRHVLGADIAVVTQGPGNLGTGTRWGFSGVAAGEAVNAVAALGGQPVGALRISAVDPRERHRGVSHHSLTAFGRVALVSTDLPVPAGLLGVPEPADAPAWEAWLPATVAAALNPLRSRHRVVPVRTGGLMAALRALPAPVSSMGRGLDDDPAYFLTAAAAGRHAASLLD